MAGIYLHIPFCKQACTYCNFHFTTSLRHKKDLVQALIKEAAAEKNYLAGETVQTIYFGGGTPSLLEVKEIADIITAIRYHYPVAAGAEITLEANPDDIDPVKLTGWKDAGINRLSLGVQSFHEAELRWMNRAHNALQAAQSIEWCQKAGLNNISIDLIYGSPLLSDEGWEANVKSALAYNIPHLSCYALTVEEKTPLHKEIHLNKTGDVDNEHQARQFLMLMNWLRSAGYEHYEVSNFALPGFRSRHNSSYWKGDKYLGLGPSAHSFNGKERRWNLANNSVYIKKISEGLSASEKEILTPVQQLNEYIMISLRTMEGMDLTVVEKKFGLPVRDRMEKELNRFTGDLISKSGSVLQLTDEGMLRADGIAAELFQ